MGNKETVKENQISTNKKSIVAVTALILSIISVFAAIQANKLAFVSLQNSYTPWLRITGVDILEADPNTVEVKYICKNFANGPALNLDITITTFGKSTTERLYYNDALMPNDEGNYSCYVNLHGKYQPKYIIEELKQGKSIITFDICLKDVFGRSIKVHQECKSIKGVFRTTRYEINGVPASFWELFLNIFTF